MKKLVIMTFVVVIAIAATPSLVKAYDDIRNTVNIYNVPLVERGSEIHGTVSTFDDRGNKCYVYVSKSGAGSISCVKQD